MGNTCVPGELRLAHEEILPYFSDRIVKQNTLYFYPPNEDSHVLFLLAFSDPIIYDLFVKSPYATNAN